jgi:hypothetical protein
MADNNFVPGEALLDKLMYYIRDNDPLRASRKLRKVFFDYLRFQVGMIDTDFDNILTDVEAALNLLDAIADESKVYRDKLA